MAVRKGPRRHRRAAECPIAAGDTRAGRSRFRACLWCSARRRPGRSYGIGGDQRSSARITLSLISASVSSPMSSAWQKNPSGPVIRTQNPTPARAGTTQASCAPGKRLPAVSTACSTPFRRLSGNPSIAKTSMGMANENIIWHSGKQAENRTLIAPMAPATLPRPPSGDARGE
jgi:hypothetical protein